MNKLEVRYEIKKLLTGEHQPEGVQSVELIGPDPGEPGVTLCLVTDDPYNLTDPQAVRRYRITVEEVEG